MNELTLTGTKYHGIHIQAERTLSNTWKYWIVDDLGGDLCFGGSRPTDSDVTDYRNDLLNK